MRLWCRGPVRDRTVTRQRAFAPDRPARPRRAGPARSQPLPLSMPGQNGNRRSTDLQRPTPVSKVATVTPRSAPSSGRPVWLSRSGKSHARRLLASRRALASAGLPVAPAPQRIGCLIEAPAVAARRPRCNLTTVSPATMTWWGSRRRPVPKSRPHESGLPQRAKRRWLSCGNPTIEITHAARDHTARKRLTEQTDNFKCKLPTPISTSSSIDRVFRAE